MSESYERLREQKEAIEARAAEREEQARWIAVTPETMPESGQDVIVWAVWDGQGQVRHAVFVKHARGEDGRFAPFVFASVGEGVVLPVLFWQPLPAPPVLP